MLGLHRDAPVLKLPPFLSALCIIIGVAWLLILPLNEYSRQTYVSENALLPGQVHTYFGGSEHNVFRAYRQEVYNLAEQSSDDARHEGLLKILKSHGLKTGLQSYTYENAGQIKTGKNVYAILQGPRADATEAMVLIGAWRNMDNLLNYSGVALVLTLARYFKRWSLWSKDIIILIPEDSTFGVQAWVDAYHDTHDPSTISSLQTKAGALQAAVAVDYPAGPWGHRFDKLHVIYDGVNGQLPNLDLLNTAVSVASGQMGVGCTIQRMWNHGDGYRERLTTMLRGMMSQALGHASGPHSSFIPYHIDAITLQTVGDGWHDEMSLGRSVEGLFRSLNNLLEHLHQSFFFYLLMHANRFVSIGTYLPSAMLIAVNFTIMSILLWIQSGWPSEQIQKPASPDTVGEKKPEMTVIKDGSSIAVVPKATLEVAERDMFPPFVFVIAMHAVGAVPFYLFNRVSSSADSNTLMFLTISTNLLPFFCSLFLRNVLKCTKQHITLIQCFSLLLLGAALSTLATLNFSQALIIGLAASPLSFIRPFSPPRSLHPAAQTAVSVLAAVAMVAISPPVMLYAGCLFYGQDYQALLVAAAWGWKVEKVYTALMVWMVWWPAWVCGAVVLGSNW